MQVNEDRTPRQGSVETNRYTSQSMPHIRVTGSALSAGVHCCFPAIPRFFFVRANDISARFTIKFCGRWLDAPDLALRHLYGSPFSTLTRSEKTIYSWYNFILSTRLSRDLKTLGRCQILYAGNLAVGFRSLFRLDTRVSLHLESHGSPH